MINMSREKKGQEHRVEQKRGGAVSGSEPGGARGPVSIKLSCYIELDNQGEEGDTKAEFCN